MAINSISPVFIKDAYGDYYNVQNIISVRPTRQGGTVLTYSNGDIFEKSESFDTVDEIKEKIEQSIKGKNIPSFLYLKGEKNSMIVNTANISKIEDNLTGSTLKVKGEDKNIRLNAKFQNADKLASTIQNNGTGEVLNVLA